MLAEAAGLGIVIGLLLGALGGGGGVLVVPALVYVLGQTGQDATTSSVIIVGLTAGAGALHRLRAGTLDWRTSLIFGVLGIPGAYLGTRLNHLVAQHVLMLAFAGVTVLAAVAMYAGNRCRRGDIPTRGDVSPRDEMDAGPMDADPMDARPMDARTASSGRGSTMLVTRPATEPRTAARVTKLVACALAIGFTTGFLGVGGGFLVVPALVIVLSMPMDSAVGASLLIITLNSVSSLAVRFTGADCAGADFTGGHLDWRIVVPFTLAAVVASVAGKPIADRLPGDVLLRAFSVLLVLVAGLVAAQSLASF